MITLKVGSKTSQEEVIDLLKNSENSSSSESDTASTNPLNSNEITNLNDETSSFESYIYHGVINKESYLKSSARKITNIALKVFGTSLVVLGRTTLINATLNYTGVNFGGWVLVVGDFIGYSALYCWALFKLIDEITTKTPKELVLAEKKSKNIVYTISTIAFSILFALVTKLPQAYVAYEFNGKNIFMPMILLSSNFSLTAFSVKRSIDYLFEKIQNTQLDNKLLNVKYLLKNKIQAYKNNISPENTFDFSKNEYKLQPKKLINDYIDHCYTHTSTNRPNKTQCSKLISIISTALGVFLTLSYLYFLTWVAYTGTLEYLDTLAGAIVLALGVLAGNLYITKAVVVDSLKDYINNSLKCFKIKLNYFQKQSPWLYNILFITSVALAFISWGTIPGTVDKYFESEAVKLYLGITCSLSVVTFNLTPMLNLIRNIVRKKFQLFSHTHSQDIISQTNNANKIIKAIDILDYNSFASMLRTLDQGVSKKVLENSELSLLDLQNEYYSNSSKESNSINLIEIKSTEDDDELQ